MLRDVTDRRLIERDAELASIRAALAGEGRRVLVIEGPAGVGKTRLLEALAEVAGGHTVLRARGGELEQQFPFGIAAQLLSRPVAALDAARRDAVLAGAAAVALDVIDPHAVAPDSPDALSVRLHGLYWLTAGLAA